MVSKLCSVLELWSEIVWNTERRSDNLHNLVEYMISEDVDERPTIDEAIEMFERGCLTREEVMNFYENHLDQELDFSCTKILDNEDDENMNPNIQILKWDDKENTNSKNEDKNKTDFHFFFKTQPWFKNF